MQFNPSPLYPVLQMQLNEPTVFWQLASPWQPPLPILHSSISNQKKHNGNKKRGRIAANDNKIIDIEGKHLQ